MSGKIHPRIKGQQAAMVEATIRALNGLAKFHDFEVMPGTWCCSSCSGAAANGSMPWLGFHEQDAERGARDMYLFHDNITEPLYALIGQVFGYQDLAVTWDHSQAKRMQVHWLDRSDQ